MTTTITTGAEHALGAALGQIPGWHWDPDTPAPPGSVLVTAGIMPPSPAEAVAVTLYMVDDRLTFRPAVAASVQVRTRAATRLRAAELADQARATLEALNPKNSPFERITRSNFAPIGQDPQQRQETSSNYTLQFVERTTP